MPRVPDAVHYPPSLFQDPMMHALRTPARALLAAVGVLTLASCAPSGGMGGGADGDERAAPRPDGYATGYRGGPAVDDEWGHAY